jgi:predicted nucleotidyltransferase
MVAADLVSSRIPLQPDAIREFCERNHVRRLALFGSVLRDDFTNQSDVDVLIEYQPGRTPGLAFFRHQRELSELFGREVDLNTPRFLGRYYEDHVQREALAIFEQA